jgi:hypothetical protein
MIEHHLIFSSLSNSIHIRLLVNSGEDTEAQSVDLHDMTLILWIIGCGDTKDCGVFNNNQ